VEPPSVGPRPEFEPLIRAIVAELKRVPSRERDAVPALDLLASIGGPAHEAIILLALESPSPAVVAAAARAAAQLGFVSAAPVLRRLEPNAGAEASRDLRQAITLLEASRKDRP